MMDSLLVDQATELHQWAAAQMGRVYTISGQPWVVQKGILAPLAMPHQIVACDEEEIQEVIKESGALIARYSSGWNSASPTEWWYTICDDPNYSLDSITNSRGKRGITKGLKECTVSRIDAKDFASLAYPIYKESLESYSDGSIMSAERFQAFIKKRSSYSGAEYWGAFVGEQLAAYATCVVLGNAVSLGSTKAAKGLLGHNPNNALFFEITRHYLRDRGMRYVSNGSRTLHHPTSIHEFLERMGYRKAYAKLHLVLSPKARLVSLSGISRWGKMIFLHKLAPGYWSLLVGFSEAVRISKTF
jgi:hypothetical protein